MTDKGCAECTDWGNGNCASGCFERRGTRKRVPMHNPECDTCTYAWCCGNCYCCGPVSRGIAARRGHGASEGDPSL